MSNVDELKREDVIAIIARSGNLTTKEAVDVYQGIEDSQLCFMPIEATRDTLSTMRLWDTDKSKYNGAVRTFQIQLNGDTNG